MSEYQYKFEIGDLVEHQQLFSSEFCLCLVIARAKRTRQLSTEEYKLFSGGKIFRAHPLDMILINRTL